MDVEGYENVSQWVYREQTGLYDVLGYDIKVSDDLPVRIETSISPSGWEISIWLRKSSGIEARLSELLRNLEIAVEDEIDFVHARFAYEENLEHIASVVQNLVEELAAAGYVSG